jgi:hypothetical protein
VGIATVESGGVTVTLDQPGLAAFVPRAGVPPIGPFRISDAGLAQVHDELAPRVADPGGGPGLLEAILGVAAIVTVGALLTGGGNNDRGTTATNPDCPYPNEPNCGLRTDAQPPMVNNPQRPPAETPPDSSPNSPIG